MTRNYKNLMRRRAQYVALQIKEGFIFDECERVAKKLDTLGIDWQNMEL